MKARDFPKLHYEDPSGFWKLVRTGKELPAAGQPILYVVDFRGTVAELQYNTLMRISNGDRYRITNSAFEQGRPVLGGPVGAVLAETFALPTTPYHPQSRHGIVEQVYFDEVLQEWRIVLLERTTLISQPTDPDHIIYWAPIPVPPDTYTSRSDEYDLWYTDAVRAREQDELDRK